MAVLSLSLSRIPFLWLQDAEARIKTFQDRLKRLENNLKTLNVHSDHFIVLCR